MGKHLAEVRHTLKTWPNFFDAVKRGEKKFEVRRDDRGFQKGDLVNLVRFDPETDDAWHFKSFMSSYPTQTFRIGWILTGGQFGIEPGYVVFSLEPVTGRSTLAGDSDA